MDKEELKSRVVQAIDRCSSLGVVTDIWLSTNMMAMLDPRTPLERLADSYKIGDVWVSAFSELQDNEFRVAFRTAFEGEGFECGERVSS